MLNDRRATYPEAIKYGHKNSFQKQVKTILLQALCVYEAMMSKHQDSGHQALRILPSSPWSLAGISQHFKEKYESGDLKISKLSKHQEQPICSERNQIVNILFIWISPLPPTFAQYYLS
nr:hypothetical transcript [Hymenolepis microstoma]